MSPLFLNRLPSIVTPLTRAELVVVAIVVVRLLRDAAAPAWLPRPCRN